MKLILLLTSLLIIKFSTVFSQDYISYHRTINNGLVHTLDSSYIQALDSFKVIKEYDFVFPTDCYIAAQVAAYVDSIDLAIYFISRAFESNASLERFTKNEILSSKFSSNNWSEVSKIKDIITPTYNASLKEKVDSMIIIDQKHRNKAHRFYKYFWWTRSVDKWVNSITSQQVLELKELAMGNGFPSYRTIGCDSNSLNSSNATTIFYHWYYPFTDLGEDFLFEELKKGNLHVKQYAILRDIETRHHKIGEDLNGRKTIYNEYCYNINWRDQVFDSSLIDSERSKIGLMSFENWNRMRIAQNYRNNNHRSKKIVAIDYLFWQM